MASDLMADLEWPPGCLGGSRVEDGDAVSFRRLGNRLAGLPKHGDVLGHRLYHQLLSLLTGGAGGDDPGQVGRVRRVARLAVTLEDHYVALHSRSFRRPACFRMLDSVFEYSIS